MSEPTISRRDAKAIQEALDALPAICHYHGDKIVRDYGMWRGEACCDTGKPSLLRRDAEAALQRALGNADG